jgi:hypothetical protein
MCDSPNQSNKVRGLWPEKESNQLEPARATFREELEQRFFKTRQELEMLEKILAGMTPEVEMTLQTMKYLEQLGIRIR